MRLVGKYASQLARIALLLLAITSGAQAQSVRYEELSGISARTGNGIAEEQNRTDWVNIREGETGTHVVLSADLRNADVTIYSNLAYGIDNLLTEARQIARKMDLPRTDFIVYRGRRTTIGVDLEFNDYLVRKGRGASQYTLDLFALRNALIASKLSRPVTLFVATQDHDLSTATLIVPGSAPRRVSETFFAPHDIKPGTTLVYETRVPRYGYGVALLFSGMSLFPVFLQATSYRRAKKARAERRAAASVEVVTVPDPATVQAQYDKQKPAWMYAIAPVLVAFFGAGAAIFFGGATRGILAGVSALQSLGVSFALVPIALLGVWGVAWLVRFLVERAEIRREGNQTVPPDTTGDTPPTWTILAATYPLLALPLVMMSLGAFPSLRTPLYALSPNGVLYFLGALVALAFTASFLIGRAARRFTHYDLPADHDAHRVIAELTTDAGVRIRRVEVVRSPTLNAYVNIWRTVGFTSRILREFSPNELRVVIAHEVGHFRAADPPRQALVSLLVTAGLVGAWYGGGRYVETHYALSRDAKSLLASPLFGFFVLPLVRTLLTGGISRRAEIAADRYAVDAMDGDGEFVIQTLTKLHTLNATPHRLKASDEAISTHPSLASRAAAIRAYGAKLGSL